MTATLDYFLDAATERTPEKQALCFAGEALTYTELWARSNQLASVLRDSGVARGDRVGIYGPKSLASGVAIHGILKAGAAYVPLDATAPPARTALIARDCGIEHIVATGPAASGIGGLLQEGLVLRSIAGLDGEAEGVARVVSWSEVESRDAGAGRLSPVTRDDLSYILYTSGSTGTPKGVVHTHRSAVAFASMAAETFLDSDDRVTNHAPLHFDLSTLDFFATVVAGGTTVIVPEAHTKFPASLSKLLEDQAISVLYAVPLALAHLLLHGALGKRDLSRLRWVLFGGEPMPPKHLRAWARQVPRARFANVYGPTEVNGVTRHIISSAPEISEGPVPIGHPFPPIRLAVVDDSGVSVPNGEPGELWVHSPTAMKGYWNRPNLNEASFATPADDEKGRKYYKTGDLVRMDEDQLLHFLGRRDRQIKTRGHRVELDEVEAALASHPAVESAAVFAVGDDTGTNSIHAVAVRLAHQTATSRDLLAHMASILPPYALPGQIELVPNLPRTHSGKVDRRSLEGAVLRRRRRPQEEAPA